jgi:hypothetical protein
MSGMTIPWWMKVVVIIIQIKEKIIKLFKKGEKKCDNQEVDQPNGPVAPSF